MEREVEDKAPTRVHVSMRLWSEQVDQIQALARQEYDGNFSLAARQVMALGLQHAKPPAASTAAA